MSDRDRASWDRIGTIFNELVELTPPEQAVRLSELSQSDPELKRAVESLLAADAVADDRLARFDAGVSQPIRRTLAPELSDNHDPLKIIGKNVGHFRVIEFTGSGGMGVVYRAHDLNLSRDVALKFPLPHIRPDANIKSRFLTEARSVGALEHPNLCSVYEAGESEYGLYLAMPFYSGETLKDLLRRRSPLASDETLAIAKQITAGLACAHGAAVIHRDLKPANIMLLADGTIKILDFGLAKTLDATHTRSGAALGTPSYMSPEQIRGAKIDARSDLWSLGVVLYEMLSGKRPFIGENDAAIAHAVLHEEPRPITSLDKSVPAQIQKFVSTLLQKDAALRYASAQAVLADIDLLQRGSGLAHRPSSATRARATLAKHKRPAYFAVAIVIVAVAVAAAPRIAESIRRPTRDAQAYDYYLRARDYERRGPSAAAESLYRKALSRDSAFALAHARLAIVYAQCTAGGSRDCYRSSIEDRRIPRPDEVQREASAALKLDPKSADAHFALGLYWEQREEPARALREFQLAQRGLKNYGPLEAAIGRTYRAQGRWNEALAQLQHAVDADPSDPTAIADLATTYSRMRRYAPAIELWNRYLTLVPDAYQAMIIKGNAYLRWTGRVDTLAAIVDRLPPEWARRSFATRVLIARIRQRPNDALAALNELPRERGEAATNSRSPALLRAQIHSELRDLIRARAYFDSARILAESGVRRTPLSFQGFVSLGLAYAGLGRTDAARKAAEHALDLMPVERNVPAGTTAMRGAAEIFAQLPDYHARAVQLLDSLMKLPAGREASAGLLRVDPAWNPLRSDPDFQHLLLKYPVT